MIARKVIAGREQIKKINKRLKAGREEEPQKSDESFKSATEGKEMVSSETEQVTYSLKVTTQIIFEIATNLETRFVLVGTVAGVETTEFGKVGSKNEKRKEKKSEGARSVVRGIFWRRRECERNRGSRSGEADEELVRLRKDAQEPVPSDQETLADLLKRVTDSYNPKKKRSSGVKVPGTARANKKRKAASSIPVEIPPTRGRATRSQKKQSEAELEKTLAESKRNIVVKGKKKVVEPVEAVEIDEIDLVLRDEDETEEMEVVTPKTKKAKTSTKKSVSKSKSAEPSSLAKRSRSAVKSRKVKIVEEEEWSGEEEEEDYDA
ncbi:DEK domain-containing chromatin-associated protein 2-like [Nicotiana tomentosiformis]|uniref:DEK domain-containing chromatin-associated protein 2-like n=1 Tax=Nicotiana tomentosiformis TaxID=4098 RepID=UPI00388C4EBA